MAIGALLGLGGQRVQETCCLEVQKTPPWSHSLQPGPLSHQALARTWPVVSRHVPWLISSPARVTLGTHTQDAKKHGQQEEDVGGEHSHRGHTDEQREDQAVQGALYPCKVGEKGTQAAGRRGCSSA